MARPPSINDRQKELYAAKIAAGELTYDAVAKKFGITRSGAFRVLSPMVDQLSGESKVADQKIRDAVSSINTLPAPLKKSSIGLLGTLLATLDNDFSEYIANSAKVAKHVSKLSINRLSKAGANPSPEDLAHVAILTKIGKESASPILESARIMGDAAAKGSSPEKPRRIVITARK